MSAPVVIIVAFVVILVTAVVLALPMLRESDTLAFYISGHNRRGDLLLRRNLVLANLRDLEVEKEFGKMDAEEFRRLAMPLAQELEQIDAKLKDGGASASGAAGRATRLGMLCPACGNLTRKSSADAEQPSSCFQCGYDFG